MRTRKRHAPLALAITAALLLPVTAVAQTTNEHALEARIAQLEAQVAALLAMQQQATAHTQAQLDSIQPAATTTSTQVEQQAPSPILSSGNAGSRFSLGGFIKLDAMLTSTTDGELVDGSAGRMFYLPSAIPVGGSKEPSTDLDSHVQFSRFWFASDGDVQGHKTRAYLEFDLFGGGMNNLGNQASTNTHGVTVRQAYVSWDNWLAGQTWSNFQDVSALPDAVDFVGPTEGTVFVRQAQLRYTQGPWSWSLENPQTVVSQWRASTRTVSDDGSIPDITMRWTTKGHFGHVSVAALARQLRHETAASTAASAARSNGFGLSLSGKYNLGKNDDIRYMLTGGRGIGRYVAFALGADGTLDTASSAIDTTGVLAGYVAWRHAFNPQLRGSLFYSRAQFDNDPAWTGGLVTRAAQSFHANLIYSPLPKLDIGAELIWGNRELESGSDGDLRRIHTSIKYSF